MRTWFVTRQEDSCIVTILKNKEDGTYSFVNLTKEHICPCRFHSLEEALKDMDDRIADGTVRRYYEIQEAERMV